MSEQKLLIEIQVVVVALQELFQVIGDKIDIAYDLLKKFVGLLYELKENGERRQHIETLFDLSSVFDSKKRALDCLLRLALGNKETHEQQQAISNDLEKHLQGHDLSNLPTEPEGNEPSFINHTFKDDNTETKIDPISVGDIDNEIRVNRSKLSEIQKVIQFKPSTNGTKTFKKLFYEIPDLQEVMKIGNLSSEEKRKKLQEHLFQYERNREKIDKVTNGKHLNLQTKHPVSMKLRLEYDVNSEETNVYKTHSAIFRNTTPLHLVKGNNNQNENTSQNELEKSNGNTSVYKPYNQNNLMLMPCDIKGNHEVLEDVRHFLSMSTDNSFTVQLPEGFNLENHGEAHLVVDVLIHQPSRKPLKRQFTLRMHVVTSDMFERASVACQIQSLELTYTNIFPSDCRMFISLPIYRDGYLDTKDRIDRE